MPVQMAHRTLRGTPSTGLRPSGHWGCILFKLRDDKGSAGVCPSAAVTARRPPGGQCTCAVMTLARARQEEPWGVAAPPGSPCGSFRLWRTVATAPLKVLGVRGVEIISPQRNRVTRLGSGGEGRTRAQGQHLPSGQPQVAWWTGLRPGGGQHREHQVPLSPEGVSQTLGPGARHAEGNFCWASSCVIRRCLV